MCRPTYFDVLYSINPWMKVGSVDKFRASLQWERLVKVYKNLGIEVLVIEQKKGLPDMVFSVDQNLLHKNTVILSNFRFAQRQGETPLYANWFEKNRYDVKSLTKTNFFEGGDCLSWKNVLYVGNGFRTTKKTIKEIASLFSFTLIPLTLVLPEFYHLDTCLFLLNETTAFYYPRAFDLISRRMLKKCIPNLIPLVKKEAYNFAANSVATDHHVVLQEGNFRFKSQIEQLGYKTVLVDVSEFMKAGGGIRCLTNVIKENYEALPS